jgi:ATP-dependent RNA helicase SUPV3L1/SUV3
MKKMQKAMREFDRLKKQLKKTEDIVSNTRDSGLWNHEASVRKRIRELRELADKQFKDYDSVFNGYLQLLDKISIRILNNYNKKNGSNYNFEEIVENNRRAYISSGIISVLTTVHIPSLVAEEFDRYFPLNPKDEYEKARKIKRKFMLHLGQTNTGKTYHAVQRLMQASNGVYLAPLRILALENFEKLNREGVPCSLITGEEEVLVENANHVCSTIEKLDINKHYDVAVIDEIQMIGDSQRGDAWTRALLGLQCEEIHICGAVNAKELLVNILNDCGDYFEIQEYVRQTPLQVWEDPFSLRDVEPGDALVAFSKRRVLELSKLFNEKGVKNSVIYGDLPPEVRRMQYQAFLNGTNKILITTDAIGMGVNLPIRRIIFMSLQKFDGEETRYLTSQEVKQIGGRAGRKGIYDVGYVGVAGYEQEFLRQYLEIDDEPIEKAVLGPSEAILKIKGMPLKEKLALWSTRDEEIKLYSKMDIRDYLLVLDNIKYFKLPENVEYTLMKLPFDVNDEELMECFLDYVEEFFKRSNSLLTKPAYSARTLTDAERYYQKLNLYYSFCKNFGIEFDSEWVYKQREKISEDINRLLLRL